MTTYRLAVLSGNTARLSACSVHHYQTITATSYQKVSALAAVLNAVVIARYPVTGKVK